MGNHYIERNREIAEPYREPRNSSRVENGFLDSMNIRGFYHTTYARDIALYSSSTVSGEERLYVIHKTPKMEYIDSGGLGNRLGV